MELLKEPPSAYEGIANVFEMARHLPTTRRMDLQVGLVCGGKLFARGRLDGYRQVNFFSEHLRDLGWREHLLGGSDEMFGCDMLFSQPAQPAQPDADPSFIRRPAVELWPLRNVHADPQR
jgi:hypothetical protein